MMRSNQELIASLIGPKVEVTKVQRIDEEETADGVPLWIITFSDGRHGRTVKRELMMECVRLKGLDLPVDIERSKMRYGYALTKITPTGEL